MPPPSFKYIPNVNMAGIERIPGKRYFESVISFLLGYLFGITVCQLLLDLINFKMNYERYSKLGGFLSSLGLYHFMEFMFKSEHYNHDLSWHDF